MLRQSLAGLVVVALAGCQASTEIFGSRSDDPGERTRLAAYAASTEYPSDAEPTGDQAIGALITGENNAIKIVNFTDQSIRSAAVWVNGSFVHEVENIPANGSVTISRADFYDATGRSLASQSTTISRIELASGDNLYRVQGPIRD